MSKPKFFPFKGRQVTLSQLSREYGISWSGLKRRYENGLRDDDLVEQGTIGAIVVNGEKTTLEALSISTGIPKPTLAGRYQKGLRGAELLKVNEFEIVFDDELISFSELSRQHNISRSTLIQRYERGLRDSELIEAGKLNVIKIDGKKTTFDALAAKSGVSKTALQHRYRKGFRGDKLFDLNHHGLGKNGEKSPFHKLVDSDVMTIKKQLASGAMSQYLIAKEHNVSEATISAIKNNKRWNHVVLG